MPRGSSLTSSRSHVSLDTREMVDEQAREKRTRTGELQDVPRSHANGQIEDRQVAVTIRSLAERTRPLLERQPGGPEVLIQILLQRGNRVDDLSQVLFDHIYPVKSVDKVLHAPHHPLPWRTHSVAGCPAVVRGLGVAVSGGSGGARVEDDRVVGELLWKRRAGELGHGAQRGRHGQRRAAEDRARPDPGR